jgi:hypothetical protein
MLWNAAIPGAGNDLPEVDVQQIRILLPKGVSKQCVYEEVVRHGLLFSFCAFSWGRRQQSRR